MKGSYQEVPRIDRPGAWRFAREYLAKNRPVVVRDSRDRWGAFETCTPAMLAEHFGDLEVKVSGDFFSTIGATLLRDYVAALDRYEELPAEAFSERSPPPYLRETPRAERRPDDFDERVFRLLQPAWRRRRFMPRGLYFRPLHLLSSKPNQRRYPGFGVFVSPRGALTRYHVDIENDSNLLTQIHGRKRGYLFPPGASGVSPRQHSFSGRGNLTRVLRGELPDYSPFEPLQFDLTPGDSVLLPRGWGHEVFTLSASISLTYNFVHLFELSWAWLKFWARGQNLEGEPMKRFVF